MDYLVAAAQIWAKMNDLLNAMLTNCRSDYKHKSYILAPENQFIFVRSPSDIYTLMTKELIKHLCSKSLFDLP